MCQVTGGEHEFYLNNLIWKNLYLIKNKPVKEIAPGQLNIQ